MDSTKPGNPVVRFLSALTKIERNEAMAVLLSFALVLVLMTSYSILKPLRDALAADWGNVGLSVTWTVNFGISLAAVGLYSAALTYVRFRVMVPAVYVFFAGSFLALYFFRSTLPDLVLVNKGFYVWVSVFSLFNLSVFWSFMTDIFNSQQARRVFGIIAAGTTVGAIVGPGITAALVDDLGANGLLLLSAGLLFFPVVAIPVLRRLKVEQLGNAELETEAGEIQTLGKNPFDGFAELAKDKYLLGICGFILFYVAINTFVYFELQNLTREYSLEFRAKVWSLIEITTNVLTLATAALVTGRIVIRLGLKAALMLMPGFVVIGVFALVAAPTLLVLGIFQVGRRVGNYAVTRPSREMLFTVLSREARFKSKPIIDVVVYRGGDVASGWIFTILAGVFGLQLTGVAVLIGVTAILWGVVAFWLGNRYEDRAENPGVAHNAAGGSHATQ